MKFFILTSYFIIFMFIACYLYQIVYFLVPFIKKAKPHKPTVLHKLAVIISARNEKLVIGELIESILNQDYPKEHLDIYVVADNCTDNTAAICRSYGVTVYERHNLALVGKGYALNYLFENMKRDGHYEKYDGFIVFDADNVLSKSFVTEINKVFSDGYNIVTGYRAPKNFDKSWISAGQSICYMYESQKNEHRMLLNNTCTVSGTGFLFSRKLLDKHGGWNYFLIAEDTEFSLNNILLGEVTGYSKQAIFYDEHPEVFAQSFRQRTRWVKGSLEIFIKYFKDIYNNIFSPSKLSCYDTFLSTISVIFLSYILIFVDTFFLLWSVLVKQSFPYIILSTLAIQYIILFMVGAITIIIDRDKLNTSLWKKILYSFTFPIYIYTYLPVLMTTLFMYKKIEWKPIFHKRSMYADKSN